MFRDQTAYCIGSFSFSSCRWSSRRRRVGSHIHRISIIGLFNSQQTNPKNAQLIFATHDVNLLSNQLFRRDQIWFTEKNRQEATDLYSLVEFDIDNNASFEQDYIQGRYGAIPFIGDLSKVIGD